MKFKFIFLICVVQVIAKCPDDCKESNFLYESFQCTPNCIDTDDCPISYDCSSINQHNDMCFYNGNDYEVGGSVRNNVTWESCMGCKCTKDTRNTTNFVCYSASCASPLKIDEGCVVKQILGECCSDTVICPPFSKCSLGNEVFTEENGKFYHPKDKCTRCSCERADGTEGIIKCQKQFCLDLLLFQQDIKRMCAPFYNNVQNDCCPSKWICPDDNITFYEPAQENEGPTCLFGDKTLTMKQKFYVDRDMGKIVCECKLPPFATCSLLSIN